MTNKDLIIETLKYLKPKSGHSDVVGSLWKDLNLDLDKQSLLRDILLTGELVNLGADLWTMQLTARGMTTKPKDLDHNGYFINNYDKFIRTITLLGIIPIIYSLLEIIKIISDYFSCCHCDI